jgi:hypothetical protein
MKATFSKKFGLGGGSFASYDHVSDDDDRLGCGRRQNAGTIVPRTTKERERERE